MTRKSRIGITAPLLAFLLGLSAFFRMPGAENVRAVQIVTLLGSGIGLGVALAHAKFLFDSRQAQ